MLRHLARTYKSFPNSKVRQIDNFQEHYDWMKANKPQLTLLYFKNSWNPECSRALQRSFLELMEHEPFESFIVDCELASEGEKTQRYYCIKYQPTFLFLSDGQDLKRVVGSDLTELTKQIHRVKEFRKKIQWELGIQPGLEVWENFHDEYMDVWNQWHQQDSWEGEGVINFDRN